MSALTSLQRRQSTELSRCAEGLTCRGGPGAAGRGLLRGGAGVPAPGGGRGGDQPAGHPHHRHRRGAALQRPGAPSSFGLRRRYCWFGHVLGVKVGKKHVLLFHCTPAVLLPMHVAEMAVMQCHRVLGVVQHWHQASLHATGLWSGKRSALRRGHGHKSAAVPFKTMRLVASRARAGSA